MSHQFCFTVVANTLTRPYCICCPWLLEIGSCPHKAKHFWLVCLVQTNDTTHFQKPGTTDLKFTVLCFASPATPPKEQKGESLGAQAKFLGCADLAFSIPEMGFHVTVPGVTMVTDYARSSSFCLCLRMLSERAEYLFLPWMPKSQSPRSRPRYEA